MSELAKRICVAAFGIPLLLGVTYLGGWYFFSIVLLVSIVAQWEFYQIQKNKKIFPQDISGLMVGIFVLFGIQTGMWFYTGLVLIICLMMIMANEMFRRQKNVSANIGVTLLGIFYIPFLLGTLLYLRIYIDQVLPHTGLAGFKFILMLFASIWICDTFAYGFGRKLGRHKLYEKVSASIVPNTCWSAKLNTSVLLPPRDSALPYLPTTSEEKLSNSDRRLLQALQSDISTLMAETKIKNFGKSKVLEN